MRYTMLLIAMFLALEGCGYSLRMVSIDEEQRESQHREELEERVARLDSEMVLMKEQVTRLQSELRQVNEEGRKAIFSLQRGRADGDVRLDETLLQLRMIRGNIEKGDHRLTELAQRIDTVSFRLNELEEIRRRLSEEAKKWDSIQKSLAPQIKEIKGVSSVLQVSSQEQGKRLQEISDRISELAEEVSPILNAQASQLDELGKQFQRLSKEADAGQISKSLIDLSNALDLLGRKITAKVDEQERFLQKTTKRLEVLESKLASLGKKSSLPSQGGEGSERAGIIEAVKQSE